VVESWRYADCLNASATLDFGNDRRALHTTSLAFAAAGVLQLSAVGNSKTPTLSSSIPGLLSSLM
jgi:hypothetical protein